MPDGSLLGMTQEVFCTNLTFMAAEWECCYHSVELASVLFTLLRDHTGYLVMGNMSLKHWFICIVLYFFLLY